jgi:DNA-binding XRE family transcriptional regulator
MELAHDHTRDNATRLYGLDGDTLSLPVNNDGPAAPQASVAECLHRGHVMLDNVLLRQLRQAKCMSQQDLADDCWRRNIQLSLTTIKRAESGRAVRFRIAREFARCFDLPVDRIARPDLG